MSNLANLKNNFLKNFYIGDTANKPTREVLFMKKSIVLVTVTEEMKKNCPFGELRCVECLSQACKPDPMEGVDLADIMSEEED